jgi:peptide/nickel transport system substrate-binding protein
MRFAARSIIIGIAALQVWVGAAGCRRKPARKPASTAPAPATPAQHQPAERGAPPAAGRAATLRIQVDQLPAQLNPYVSPDLWCQRLLVPAVLEPLVQILPSGAVQPYLAAEVQPREGGRRFRFRLRDGVRFHDGRPLTSTDVKFTLDRLTARNAPSELLRADLADLEEVRADEPLVVEILLRRPNHLIMAVLAEVGILAAHQHGRYGLRNPKLNWMPVGSGPFEVVDRKSRDQLELQPHRAYWGQRPGVTKLLVSAIPDPGRALAALRNDEVDLLPAVYPGYYPDQVSDERLKQRFRALRLHPYRLRLVLPNLRHPLLRDRRVRAALDQLIDRDRLIRDQRHGLGQTVSAPIWTLSGWYDRGLHSPTFDRVAAGRLLDAAGWRESKPGAIRQRAGKPLRLKLLRSRESAEMQEVARVLQSDLRSAGVDLQVEAGDFGFIKAQLKRGRFELALLGMAPRPESDLSVYLHSKGELNYGGYKNPVVDSLLDTLRGAGLPDERVRVGRRLHRALAEDPPYLLLYAPIELMLASRRVRGLPQNGRWPKLAPLSLSAE